MQVGPTTATAPLSRWTCRHTALDTYIWRSRRPCAPGAPEVMTPTCAAGDRTRSAEVCYTAELSNAGCVNRLRRQAKEERCWLAPSWDRRKQCIYLSTDINSSCGHSVIIMWISQTPWSPSVNHLFECILLLNFALGMKSRHNVAQHCIYLNYFYSPQPHNCLSTALFHRRDSGMNDVRCNGRAIDL